MSQDMPCKFCEQIINTQNSACTWCGFSQSEKAFIPGTLRFATSLGNYIVGEVVSVDGESTTYLSFDKLRQQRVLIKEFLPVSMVTEREDNYVTPQEDKQVLFKNLLLDFIELYTTLKGIDSAAMPKIFDIFSLNKTAYAVIEDVQGTTLKQVLIKRGKPFSFKETRWMFQGLFELLEMMANLNISHGGISDETVIFTPDNTIILTGFAIQDLRTKNDHIVYKLFDGFSAPEQYNPKRFQGFYTDIYSVASLLYYTVTGSVLIASVLYTKDILRIFPAYAVEALKYAIKENPEERIDSIVDFTLMLDDKAVIEKQITSSKAVPIRENEIKKLVQYSILGLLIILVLIFAFNSIGGDKGSNTSSIQEISSNFLKISVPNLEGKDYLDVINNGTYQKDFLFMKQEVYSDIYNEGVIISHEPGLGEVVPTGTTIYLQVSIGAQSASIPTGVVGILYEDLVKKLERLGIKYKKEYVDQSNEFRAGMVAGVSPAEGSTVTLKTDIVTIYVANDKPLSTPDPFPTPTIVPTPIPTPPPTIEPPITQAPTQTPAPTPSEPPIGPPEATP